MQRGVQMYTITGYSDHYIAASHRKQFHISNHLRLLHLWQQWLMVQFGFLSAYDLYFKKVMQTDTIK